MGWVLALHFDTFIVRALLVPALATMLGHWSWAWPGRGTGQ